MLTNMLEDSGIPYIQENGSYRLQTGELIYQVMGNWFAGNATFNEDWLLTYIGRQPVCISASCLKMLRYYSSRQEVYCQTVDSKFIEFCIAYPESAVAIIGGVMLLGSMHIREISTGKLSGFGGLIKDLVEYGRGVER